MGSGNRAGKQAMRDTKAAVDTARANMKPVIDYFGNAADTWTPERNLREYDSNVASTISDMNSGIAAGNSIANNAYANMGTQADIESRLNPYMDTMLNKAMNQVQGSAGAALQSSNTQNAIVDRVAGMAGDMWNKASQDSFNYGNAGIGLGNQQAQTALAKGTTTHDIYNTQLQNRNLPGQQRAQLQADLEAASLDAMGQAAAARAAARSTDWFS